VKLYVTKYSDGSVSLEWISQLVRFGISLEQNPSESSWYYVSKDILSDSGLITESELDCLREYFAKFPTAT